MRGVGELGLTPAARTGMTLVDQDTDGPLAASMRIDRDS
jgi:hypothetical protein